MLIARAWTLRRKRDEVSAPPPPTRSASMQFSEKPVDTRTISPPVALLSTTNMLSYNAPDVSAVRAQRKASFSVSSRSSARSSADESDTSSTSHTSQDTALTDVSSIASSSPTSSPSPKEKETTYFHSKSSSLSPPIPLRLSRSASTSSFRHTSQTTSLLEVDQGLSPEIPQRAPSHSKIAHEVLARKRSLQAMSRTQSISSITSSSRETRRSSIEFFSRDITDAPAPSIPALGFASSPSLSGPSISTSSSQHRPFDKELMQLYEIAEEFGGALRDVERESDLRVIRQKGLARFCADDYLREIQSLSSGFFASAYPSHPQQQEVAWI